MFNGKELWPEMNLNLLFFENRLLDRELDRFTTVDKLSWHPKQVDKSPYSAMWNNPFRYNDPDGNYPNSSPTGDPITDAKRSIEIALIPLTRRFNDLSNAVNNSLNGFKNVIIENSDVLINSANQCENFCGSLKNSSLMTTIATGGASAEVSLPLAGVAAAGELLMKGAQAGIGYIANDEKTINEAKQNVVSEVSSKFIELGLRKVPLSSSATAAGEILIDNFSDRVAEKVIQPKSNGSKTINNRKTDLKETKLRQSTTYTLTVTDNNFH